MATLRASDLGISHSTVICVARLDQRGQNPINFLEPVQGRPARKSTHYTHIFWNIHYRFYFKEPNSYKPTVVPRPYIAGKKLEER